MKEGIYEEKEKNVGMSIINFIVKKAPQSCTKVVEKIGILRANGIV